VLEYNILVIAPPFMYFISVVGVKGFCSKQ